VRNIEKAKTALAVPDNLCTFVQADLMNSNDSAKKVDYEGFNLLVDACKAVSSHPHLVMCSSILVTSTWHPLALLINGMTGMALYWKYYGEEYLKKSGLRYTIVRPGGLVDSEGGATGLVVSQGDSLRGRTSRADVAEVMLQCVTRELTLGGVTFEVVASTGAGSKAPQSEAEWNALFGPLKKDASS